MTGLRIPYVSEGFPPATVQDDYLGLAVSWDDLLWAAVTVGRPSWHYVFQHGAPSHYEALFRWSLLRMALEQAGPMAHRLRRTDAAKTLDPTEKGAVNYFLGMVICKVFADKLLNVPWVLHLDVWRSQLAAVLKGRSRPDLVARERATRRWHAFECKGRVSPPDAAVRSKAKAQALRVVRVDGLPCGLHIGAITYFRNDVLNFYWCDPEAARGPGIEVSTTPEVWRHYYQPISGLVADGEARREMERSPGYFWRDARADVEVSVHPAVARPLFGGDWSRAQAVADEARPELAERGYRADGLALKAGSTWYERFEKGEGSAFRS